MESGEARIASGIGGVTQPISVVYVPVGLAGCNGVIRFIVVEQDVPPLLPVEIMRTLQASLDLTDDGDKVIFRQFGAVQSRHTVIRADQLDPDGWPSGRRGFTKCHQPKPAFWVGHGLEQRPQFHEKTPQREKKE